MNEDRIERISKRILGGADKDYDRLEKEIVGLLKSLQTIMKKHRLDFDKDGKVNYGYSGDLDHVKNELKDLVDFLKSAI